MPKASRSKAKHRRHKKWIDRAKGFRGTRHTVFKRAKEAVLKAGQYAYRDRRQRKTVMRARFTAHINAAVRQHGLTYSRFIASLRAANIELDRKVLAQIAREKPDVFEHVVDAARGKK